MAKGSFYRKVLSPAKLNLILRIGPRRNDGYHDLESLMVPLAWGDELGVLIKPSKTFECEVNCPGLKVSPRKNLVFRAANLFSKEFGIAFHARISLKKNIPTGAGLGGGSGNAAMVLRILAEWAFGKKLSSSIQKRLSKIAAKLGADIPFFLGDTAAWCTGFGEKCKPIKLRSYNIVVVMPKTKIPTPWAYKTLDLERERSRERIQLLGIPSWIKENISVPLLENDFEAVALLYKPKLKTALQLLALEGAVAARMSGSGSAFFGIFKSKKDAVFAAKRIRARGIKAIATVTV